VTDKKIKRKNYSLKKREISIRLSVSKTQLNSTQRSPHQLHSGNNQSQTKERERDASGSSALNFNFKEKEKGPSHLLCNWKPFFIWMLFLKHYANFNIMKQF